jgi:murein DD-endopeptidase MepM/ murein hydrolase activator NlpD
MRLALSITAALLLLAPSAHAAKKKRVRRTPARSELKVKPSEAIEARVEEEIRKASEILQHTTTDNFLASPYLVSAIYYHDGFLVRYPEDKPDADPARRILSHISRGLTHEGKQQFVELLRSEYWTRNPEADGGRFVVPVRLAIPSSRRLRRTHPSAVDLFSPEGSVVRSASAGLVLLAENGWNEADPFSTSSHAGGNTAIIFDPSAERFYRYCHMAQVTAVAGDVVEAGDEIGRVGHTGLNASRNGHGRHLHFEVNEYLEGEIRPMDYKRIWALLREAAGEREIVPAHRGMKGRSHKR